MIYNPGGVPGRRPHLDKPEEQSLNFVLSVPKEIMLCQQKNMSFTMAKKVFMILMKMRFVKIVVFWNTGNTFTAPTGCRYGYFISGSMTETLPETKKIVVFFVNISFTWAGSIFGSIIC